MTDNKNRLKNIRENQGMETKKISKFWKQNKIRKFRMKESSKGDEFKYNVFDIL
jgi:hypothetical protein